MMRCGILGWGLVLRAMVWPLVLALASLTAAEAQERRMALVVGNAAYETLPDLETPVADAQGVATALRDLGFEVTVLTDVGAPVFQAVLTTFASEAKSADAVLFYYAGHAFQKDGVNHLVPIAARLDDPARLAEETWTLDSIAAALKNDKSQLLIFLDACRDNPLPASAGAESAGLAQFDGGAGSFVSFATAPGQLAWDQTGGSANSPYTAALLRHIGTAGQSLSDLTIAVRNDVEAATQGKQTPWEQSSLRSQFFFAPEAAPAGPDLPEFDLVDEGSAVVVEDTQIASADSASETRSVATDPGADLVIPAAADLPRGIQEQLTRIGCYAMRVDGDWGNGSRNAMRQYYKAKGVEPGEVEPTEAVFRALAAEPEKTCTEPAAVVTKKADPAPKSTSKKSSTKKSSGTTTKKKSAPAPTKKKSGVDCKFIGIAVICS